MRAKELRTVSPETLRTRAEELAREIASLRFGGLEKEKNKKKLIGLRHERARVLTILQERRNEK